MRGKNHKRTEEQRTISLYFGNVQKKKKKKKERKKYCNTTSCVTGLFFVSLARERKLFVIFSGEMSR